MSEISALEFDAATQVWGPYPNYGDIARFEYGRRMWRLPAMRSRLQAHWLDERHPHRERFQANRAIIEEVLSSTEPAELLDQRFRPRGLSLRGVARDIPPVFGGFF